MAIIKTSSLIDAIRNSIGDQTFSVNAYGPFVRTRVTPANPQSSYQTHVRDLLNDISVHWRLLSMYQQGTWLDGTHLYPKTNALGETYYLSAYNFYMACNLLYFPIRSAILDEFTDTERPVQPVWASTDIVIGDGSITGIFESTPNDGNLRIFIYASSPQSGGVSYCRSAYRFMNIYPADGSTDYDISDVYLDRFTFPLEGQKVFFKAIFVDSQNGLASIPSSIAGVCVS